MDGWIDWEKAGGPRQLTSGWSTMGNIEVKRTGAMRRITIATRSPLGNARSHLAGSTTIVPAAATPTTSEPMPRALAALSPKEEENVREVLAMRCRAACRPYLQGR